MSTLRKDKIIKILAAVVVLALAVSYLVRYITVANLETMIVPAEQVYETYETYGFVCADEYLLTAAFDGELVPVIEEGKRVGKNYAVYALKRVNADGSIEENLNYFYAPLAGLVSYRIDGYENLDDLNQICALDLAGLSETLNQSESTETLPSGQACAKIINNVGGLRLICTLEKSDYTTELQEKSTVEVNFPQLGFAEQFTIVSQTDLGTSVALELTIKAPHDSLYLQRVVAAEFGHYVKKDVVLPKDALVYRESEAGVYVISKKFVTWKTVEIISTDEINGTVVVDGLSEGDEVILKGQRVKEGMYIR